MLVYDLNAEPQLKKGVHQEHKTCDQFAQSSLENLLFSAGFALFPKS